MSPRTRRLIIPGILLGLVVIVVVGALRGCDGRPGRPGAEVGARAVQRQVLIPYARGWALALVALGGVLVVPAIAAEARASTPAPPSTAYPSFGLSEVSGMVLSVRTPGVLWVVEDSGEPIVRSYDSGGRPVGSVTMAGWNNRDTEALAMGPGATLWVADIGDNLAVRESVVVHTFAEPAEPGAITLEPVSYRLSFPNGPRDAESAMVDPRTGRLFVATKSVIGPGGLYVAPATLVPDEIHELTRVAGVPSLVTDGTFSPDGSRLVLRVLTSLQLDTEARVYDVLRDDAGNVVGLDEVGDAALPSQTQGEAIAVTPDGAALLLGSEGATDVILSVPFPDGAVPPAATTTPGRPSASPGAGGASSPTGSAGPPAAVASCGVDDPAECLRSPIGWLVIGGTAFVISVLAVTRRLGAAR